jgi:AraC-like DNA-binding protein
MQTREWSKIWHNARLDVGLLQAFYVDHAFPRHSHDYYVICVVKRGYQTFMHQGSRQFTPPGGAILINPGTAHTGEAADEKGFEMLCLYPTVAAMQRAASDLTGRRQAPPFFREVRVDQPWLRDSIVALHKALAEETDALEVETRFTWTLAQLVKRYADNRFDERRPGRERKAVRQARRTIDERFAQGISLTELAENVSLSPYYLLRVFRAEVGMPPHAYLESVRIRQAQRLIEAGKPLVEVAAEVGFSSQSHLTERFRQIVGVTPGRYAQQVRQ